MKKLILALIFLSTNAYAAIDNPLNFTEEDGSPDTYPWRVKVTNGSLTDNGDGTISISTSGGAGTPGGTDRDIQFNDGGSFGGDRTIQWYKTPNTLVISRDSGQSSQPAIIISGDSNNRLAVISHDGGAFFQHLDVANTISVDATNQRLGIGTSSPLTKLHVVSDNNIGNPASGIAVASFNQFSVGGATDTAKRFMMAIDTTTNYGVIGAGRAGFSWYDLYLQPNDATGVPIVTIKASGGNVGIGTTSPGAQLQVTSLASTTKGSIIKAATSQSANMMEFQDSSGNVQLAVDSNYALATTSTSTAQQIQARSRTGMGGVGGDFTFEVKRDGTNNSGNAAQIKLTDNTSSAYIKLKTNTGVQNATDLEFHNQSGQVYVAPYSGGNFYYNPVQNTTDISILQIPTQTMYPGGGTSSPQGLMRIKVCPIAASSPNSLVDTASFWIEGAPTQSTNMTMTNRISALIQAGDPAGVPMVISADNIQTANLLEFKTAEGAVLMDVEEDGVILLSRDAVVVTNISGEMAFDTNAHTTNRGTVQVYDGTANTYVVAVQAADTPSDGQVPTWHTGGVISWDTASGGGHKVFMNFPIQSAKLSDDVGTRIEATRYYWRGLFEDGTNALNKNVMLWQGRMDDNWDSSALTAKIDYIMISSDSTSTAGAKISWDVSIMAVTSGDAVSLDTESFAASCIGSQQVPTVMSRDNTMSIPITNSDSLAPGDWFIVKLRRDGSDTITGDAAVISFALTQ